MKQAVSIGEWYNEDIPCFCGIRMLNGFIVFPKIRFCARFGVLMAVIEDYCIPGCDAV
jgi:hypothetical protein